MNYRKLASWQEAEKIIPVGGKCFLDPRGERWVEHRTKGRWYRTDGEDGFLYNHDAETYGATPYEATEEAVEISAAEAASRMVDGLPVECMGLEGWEPMDPRWSVRELRDLPSGEEAFRIPAAQPEEDIYQIAVPKGTVVPERFIIWNPDITEPTLKAHVVKQEVKGG